MLRLIIYFFLCIAVVSCKVPTPEQNNVGVLNRAMPQIQCSKDSFYIAEPLDTFYINNANGYNDVQIVIETTKPINSFLETFIANIGKPYEKLAENTTDHSGTYRWSNVQLYGHSCQVVDLNWFQDTKGGAMYNCITIYPLSAAGVNLSGNSNFAATILELATQQIFKLVNPDTFPHVEEVHLWNIQLADLGIDENALQDALYSIWGISSGVEIQVHIDSLGMLHDMSSNDSSNDSCLDETKQILSAMHWPIVWGKINHRHLNYTFTYDYRTPLHVMINKITTRLKTIRPETIADWEADEISYSARYLPGSKTPIIATTIDGYELLLIWRYENGTWKRQDSLGGANTPLIEWMDLDGDGDEELVTSSGFNMNGNSWKTVYRFDSLRQHFYKAGNYHTDEKIDLSKKEIYAMYVGSWYMPISQTIWRWSKGYLVAVCHVEIALLDGRMNSERSLLSYSENPYWQNGRDTLVLKKTIVFSDGEQARRSRYWKKSDW